MYRSLPLIIGLTLALTGVACAPQPPRTEAPASATTAAAGLVVTRSDNSSWPQRQIELAAEYSAAQGGVSFVVMAAGEIIYERYDQAEAIDRALPIASGSKSLAGLLAVAAEEDGLLTLDEPVAQTLTEWQADDRAAITIRHLLTLTSGLEQRRGHRPSYAESVTTPAVHPPGQVFKYGSAPFQVFGEVMRRKLAPRQESVLTYLQRRILDPIGVSVPRWVPDSDGHPRLDGGAMLTARGWAAIGELVRQQGTWQGSTILSSAVLAESWRGTPANPAYGLSWWLNQPISDQQRADIPQLRRGSDLFGSTDLPPDLVMAAGKGQQRLYILPQQGLVVVRQTNLLTADGRRRHDFSDREFLLRLLQGTSADGMPLD